MPLVYSRPNKLDHADTIRYEIQMLRFSYQRLAEQRLTERDAWVYLESFLLHYRTLSTSWEMTACVQAISTS